LPGRSERGQRKPYNCEKKQAKRWRRRQKNVSIGRKTRRVVKTKEAAAEGGARGFGKKRRVEKMLSRTRKKLGEQEQSTRNQKSGGASCVRRFYKGKT